MKMHSKEHKGEAQANPEQIANSLDAKAVESSSVRRWRIGKWPVIALVAVVVLVVASIYLYAVLTTKKSEQTSVSATHFETATVLVDQARSGAIGNSMQTSVIDGLGGRTADGFYAYSTAEYQASGAKFKTKPLQSAGAGFVGNSVDAAADYKSFVDFFARNHFDRYYSQNGDSGYISATDRVVFVNYDLFSSDDMICTVWHADASGTALKNHVASIGCAKKRSYKDAAKMMESFYEAYVKANPTKDSSTLTFGNPVASDGTDGYKYTSIYQVDASKIVSMDEGKTDFNGYYYLAPGTTDWKYFKSSVGVLACADLNTEVLKKAFAGLQCT